MASYIAEVHRIWDEFMQDLKDGAFDEPEQEQESDEDSRISEESSEEVLEQTIRDYNDAINEIGGRQ